MFNVKEYYERFLTFGTFWFYTLKAVLAAWERVRRGGRFSGVLGWEEAIAVDFLTMLVHTVVMNNFKVVEKRFRERWRGALREVEADVSSF